MTATPPASGRTTAGPPPMQREVVALWHTNCVLVEVPVAWSKEQVEQRILALIDSGDLAFESVEGGLFRDGEIPEWWLDHASVNGPESAETADD